MTIDAIFKAFGGGQNVADILAMTAQGASNMKARGAIPPRHWPRLVTEAKARAERSDVTPEQADVLREVTFENLAAIQAASEKAA